MSRRAEKKHWFGDKAVHAEGERLLFVLVKRIGGHGGNRNRALFRVFQLANHARFVIADIIKTILIYDIALRVYGQEKFVHFAFY